MEKINLIRPFFFEILQRYCKLVILGKLDMLGYDNQKQWYQSVENLDVYFLEKKNRFISHHFVKILLRYLKLVVLHTS